MICIFRINKTQRQAGQEQTKHPMQTLIKYKRFGRMGPNYSYPIAH